MQFVRCGIYTTAVMNLLSAVTPLLPAFIVHAVIVLTCVVLVYRLRWPTELAVREVELRAMAEAPSES